MVRLRVIHRDPTFDARLFCYKKSLETSFPFNEKNMLLFGYARMALYEGLKILDLKEGENILVPNYICNVAVAPMHRLNIKVKFYEVDSNLIPLWSRLEQIIDKNTRALLIVNYFGFPNDLGTARDLCDRHGIYLIEDNAHSFLSLDDRKPLGSTGDISIFSFRKIVPIPNGAALLVNDKSLWEKLSKPKYLRRKNKDLRFLVRTLLVILQDYFQAVGRYRGKEKDFEKCRIKDISEEYNIEKYFVTFSRFGYFLLRHFNFDYIKEQRRKTYNEWLNFFSYNKIDNVKVVFPSLRSGVIPSCFPVLVEDQKQFITKMWKQGIESFPWPFLPQDSNERYFSKKLVCLPVFPNFELERFLKNN